MSGTIRAMAADRVLIDLVDASDGKLKKYVNAFPNSRVPGTNIETKSVVRVR